MSSNQRSAFDTNDDFSVCMCACVISRIVTTGEHASHTAIGPNSVAEQSTSTVPPPAAVDAAAPTTLPAPTADDTTNVTTSTATTGRRYRTGRRWTPRPWRRTAGIVLLSSLYRCHCRCYCGRYYSCRYYCYHRRCSTT